MIDHLNTIQKYWFIIVMGILGFAIMYIYFEPTPTEIVETKNAEVISGEFKDVEILELEQETIREQLDSSFSHSGVLQDVTSGQKILGYQSSGLARGRVLIKYNEEQDQSTIISSLINVPDINDNVAYYGWLVDTDNETYISIGSYSFFEDRITNGVQTPENATEYERFVVTLQENNSGLFGSQRYGGDASHVLEGIIQSN